MSEQDWRETLLATGSDAPFYLSDRQLKTHGELAAEVARVRALLADHKIGPDVAVTIVGDFSFLSVAALLALLMNGNIVIPNTVKSLKSNLAEINALKPAFEVDATGAGLAFKAFADATDGPLENVIPKDAPGLVVFTSGTSGRPKAIVHNVSFLLEKFSTRQPRSARAIPLLLFDHMGGFNTLMSILLGRGSIVFSEDRGIDAVLAQIEKFDVDLLPTTPTFLSIMLVSEAWKRFDLTSLKIVTYGTEVMNEALLGRLNEIMPDVRFKQTYGLSEVGVLMTSSRGNENTWVKLVGEGLETKIEDGILWVKTSSVMVGRVIFDDDGGRFEPNRDEWFCTGDLVDVDDEYLRFKGRATDIINVSGLKVYPNEVENCLMRLDCVANAVVFGKKNRLVGEVVAAQIELRDANANFDETRRAIMAHCGASLDRFKVPREISFVDGVEVTDRLKTRRRWENA